MPAGKQTQSNAMLYTLISFIALFIISTTCAVIFYVKSEEYKTQKKQADDKLNEVARPTEQNSLTKIVGKLESGKSYLGTLTKQVNELTAAITGQSDEESTAAVKVNNAKDMVNKALTSLGNDASFTAGEFDTVDLLGQIKSLKEKLDQARQAQADLDSLLNDTQAELQRQKNAAADKENDLNEELKRTLKMVEILEQDYKDLEESMLKSGDEQVADVMAKLDKSKEAESEKNAQIQALQSRLAETETELKDALEKLAIVQSPPSMQVAAYKPDAKIVRIDSQAGVIYLNKGSDNHVYPGLTFSVYDSSVPIPEDGRGKAEIEVFNVQPTVSAAKINLASRKNPIVPEDIVANLIWDSESSNKFVVTGDFDFNRDGVAERDGIEKISQLIERWGGQIVDSVSIETNFIIMGSQPQVLAKPTTEETDANPSLLRKYEESIAAADQYDRILSRAVSLSIPVFNQDRFLYLIGYNTLASKSDPF